MVFYHTSGNVKMLRNIMLDYNAANDVSPFEYMKIYVEKCPDSTDDTKLSWITETFLGIQKHGHFLRGIAVHMSDELTEEEQDYFVIILHAITFQLSPKDMQFLYKCLFNLSKQLLGIFTKFLSNNEVLTFIAQIAQSIYDTNFTTEKIINPLFVWQPYISEMAHSYAEYVTKIENRKLKAPTIPMQLNVLNRKGKEDSVILPQTSIPITPPNSVQAKKRVLTKNVIDRRLKQIHEKNRQKAANLLNDVKNKNYHYAQVKSDKSKVANTKDEIENETSKQYTRPKHNFTISTSALPPIRETVANIRRTNRRIQLAQDEELEWLQNLMTTSCNTAKIEELEEFDRREREKERLLDIERKHLVGQISYEEAVLAKKKIQNENKKKYEEILREKEKWNQEIEKWKREQMEKNRKYVEKLSMDELSLLQAKNGIVAKKKETAEKFKKESEMILANALKVRQEELERKINMIKEIKILAMIARKARVPKIIDLTETSGFGLLCEMSLAELQERSCALKIGLREELERKKKQIKEDNAATKQAMEQTKETIDKYMIERAAIRKQNKKTKITLDNSSSKEINELKKILQEKRKLRTQLNG